MYGLWSKDIHRGVLFHQVGGVLAPLDCSVVPTWEDSPSWSWAALHKYVVWNREAYNYSVHYLCDIEFLRLPDTVHLRFCGMLMQCPSNFRWLDTLSCARALCRRMRGSDDNGFLLDFHPDQWFDSTFDEWMEWLPDVKPVPTGEELQGMRDERMFEAFLESIIIMPILLYKTTKEEGNNWFRTTVLCLLLQAQPEPECGVYRRVGVMEATKICSEELDPDTIMVELRGDQEALDHRLFQPVDSAGNYTITVV